jgi:SWIM zinc finger
MATVASPPRAVSAPPPIVRHGTCRLTVRIRGTDYRLRPMPAPAGFKAVWTLRKLDPHATATYTVAAPKGAQPGCTCPDHEINKSVCKHIMALAALGLIAKPKAARPVKARTRRVHAATARQAIAEAREKARQVIAEEKALTPEQRRHLAEMRVPEGWQIGGTGKAALASAAPAPAAPSFAAGFRQAVADHLARRNGTAAPDPSFPTCAGCGEEFEPTASDDYCEACLREGGSL